MHPHNNSIPERQSMHMLAQLADLMLRQGVSFSDIVTKLKILNKEECIPPLSEEEVEKIAKDPRRYLTAEGELEQLEPASSARRDRIGKRLSEFETEQVRWLWSGRIPLGKLTILDGDPGLGKSMLTLDIAARVTTGRQMPDGTPTVQGGVVLVAPEDGAGDTIRPRLEAAKGDPAQVLLLNTVEHRGLESGEVYERTFTIPDDLVVLEEAINRVKAVLVILDPLTTVLAPDNNYFRDQDMRRALTPLSQLAERTGCAVVLIRHLNKGNVENKLYKGGGSIAIIAVVRVAFMVTRDPDDENKRILSNIKNNLGKEANPIKFQVVENELGVPYIQWLGETDQPALTTPNGDANLSYERQTILKILKDSIKPLTPKEIAEHMGLEYKRILVILGRMQEAGQIDRPYRGHYTTPNHPSLTKKDSLKSTETTETTETSDTNDTKPVQENVSKVSKESLLSELSQSKPMSQREPAISIPVQVMKPLADCRHESCHWMYWHSREGDILEVVCPICDQAARQSSKLSPKRRALYNIMKDYPPLEGELRSAWIERIGPIITVAM